MRNFLLFNIYCQILENKEMIGMTHTESDENCFTNFESKQMNNDFEIWRGIFAART